MIAPEVVADIRQRADIAEVIGQFVSLRKAGRSFTGLCPFHAEKTPSFSVSAERGVFHCFGCGVGGDVFAFVMQLQGMSFPEAARHLGERFGVAVVADEAFAAERERVRLLGNLNEFARRRWVAALRSEAGSAAREYLRGRGVTDESIERFGIGFCPVGGTGLGKALQTKPAALAAAVEIGLLMRDGDGYRERIAGRIVFPIRDAAGIVRGFSGRAMSDSTAPKYWNSPESPLFKKTEHCFGVFEAAEAAAKRRRVFIVEGQFDVLAMAQAGFTETFAISGTALNAPQMRLARRLAPVATLVFDGDESGRKSALRSFGAWLRSGGEEPFVAALPSGDDPDSVFRRLGMPQAAEFLENLFSKSQPASVFAYEFVSDAGRTLADRRKVAESLVDVLADARDPILRGMLAEKFTGILGVRIGDLVEAKLRNAGVRHVEPQSARLSHPESVLLAILASNAGIRADVAGDRFHRKLLAEMSPEATAVAESILSTGRIPEGFESEIAAAITAIEGQDDAPIVAECFQRLWKRQKAREVADLGVRVRQFEAAGDSANLALAVRDYEAALRGRVAA